MTSEPVPPDRDWVEVSHAAIEPSRAVDFVSTADSGAVVLFLGTVRDHSPGRTDVTRLEYEAYEEVVESKISEIITEARGRWPVAKVAALHRLGELPVGEVSVAVAASSAHRVDAFPAARYIIDELKGRAPIWKKEHWAGGAEWVREDVGH